jgi:hypothetical protein
MSACARSLLRQVPYGSGCREDDAHDQNDDCVISAFQLMIGEREAELSAAPADHRKLPRTLVASVEQPYAIRPRTDVEGARRAEGARTGRHPEAGRRALERIAAALAPSGRLFVDGGDPLREILL